MNFFVADLAGGQPLHAISTPRYQSRCASAFVPAVQHRTAGQHDCGEIDACAATRPIDRPAWFCRSRLSARRHRAIAERISTRRDKQGCDQAPQSAAYRSPEWMHRRLSIREPPAAAMPSRTFSGRNSDDGIGKRQVVASLRNAIDQFAHGWSADVSGRSLSALKDSRCSKLLRITLNHFSSNEKLRLFTFAVRAQTKSTQSSFLRRFYALYSGASSLWSSATSAHHWLLHGISTSACFLHHHDYDQRHAAENLIGYRGHSQDAFDTAPAIGGHAISQNMEGHWEAAWRQCGIATAFHGSLWRFCRVLRRVVGPHRGWPIRVVSDSRPSGCAENRVAARWQAWRGPLRNWFRSAIAAWSA